MPSFRNKVINHSYSITLWERFGIFCFLLKNTILWHLLVLLPACFLTANAADLEIKGITVSNPYLVAFGKSAKSGAGYFEISNKNSYPVILNNVKADFGIAMLHKTSVDKKSVAKMKHLKNIVVPSNALLKLEPGGVHIMFMNISTELDQGSKYPLTLVFEEQGSLEIDLIFKGAKNNQKSHKHKHGHSHKHDH